MRRAAPVKGRGERGEEHGETNWAWPWPRDGEPMTDACTAERREGGEGPAGKSGESEDGRRSSEEIQQQERRRRPPWAWMEQAGRGRRREERKWGERNRVMENMYKWGQRGPKEEYRGGDVMGGATRNGVQVGGARGSV